MYVKKRGEKWKLVLKYAFYKSFLKTENVIKHPNKSENTVFGSKPDVVIQLSDLNAQHKHLNKRWAEIL